MYQVTKTYGHDLGLSACFRQWRATHSHCSFLHGYALSFKFVFEAETLDARNWVIDFGGLDELKTSLKSMFDHKTVVAKDDPNMPIFMTMNTAKLADVLVLERVGCEAFAELACKMAQEQLDLMAQARRVRIVSCEVREHGANSAIYIVDQLKKGFGER